MDQNLITVINECDDFKETLDKLRADPLAAQIADGKYDPVQAQSYAELFEALKHAAYLAVNAKATFQELVDRIGFDQEAFDRTYERVPVPQKLADMYQTAFGYLDESDLDTIPYLATYAPKAGANSFFVQELRLHYGSPPYTAAKLRQFPIPADVAAMTDVELLQRVMIFPTDTKNKNIAQAAIYADRVDCLKFIWERMNAEEKDHILPEWLFEYDSIQCFEFLQARFEGWDSYEINDIYDNDASQILDFLTTKYGHAYANFREAIKGVAHKCLEVILKHGYVITLEDLRFTLRCENSGMLLIVLRAKPFKLQDDSTLSKAVRMNLSIDVIDLLAAECKVSQEILEQIQTPEACEYFCQRGHIPDSSTLMCLIPKPEVFKTALKYRIRTSGATSIRPEICERLAHEPTAELLKYAHELGCRWTSGIPIAAAEKGQYQPLKYAIENGCPHDMKYLLSIVKPKSLAYQYLSIRVRGLQKKAFILDKPA